jgi:tol-pal system protein YbgF
MARRPVLALLLLAASLWAAPMALAQDRTQSLADIKADLSSLMSEFNSLKAELLSSGAVSSGAAGGDALQRLDAIEAELQRLTARTEEVELKVNRVATDGTNRVGDLEFRVCELTTGCDVGALPQIAVLGGGGDAAPAPVTPTEPVATGGVELAANEQADFDRAKGVLGQGDFRAAADLFAAYAQSYPGGPLAQEAQVLQGDALTQLGDKAPAARAYLDAYSGAPEGAFAAEALLKLGQSLGDLGQTAEACVTLAEVPFRFPGTVHATSAEVSRQGLACQ